MKKKTFGLTYRGTKKLESWWLESSFWGEFQKEECDVFVEDMPYKRAKYFISRIKKAYGTKYFKYFMDWEHKDRYEVSVMCFRESKVKEIHVSPLRKRANKEYDVSEEDIII